MSNQLQQCENLRRAHKNLSRDKSLIIEELLETHRLVGLLLNQLKDLSQTTPYEPPSRLTQNLCEQYSIVEKSLKHAGRHLEQIHTLTSSDNGHTEAL